MLRNRTFIYLMFYFFYKMEKLYIFSSKSYIYLNFFVKVEISFEHFSRLVDGRCASKSHEKEVIYDA